MTKNRHVRSLGAWVLAGLAMLLLQYQTVYGHDFGPIGHDTNPYRGPVHWIVQRLAPITLLPLGPIARDSEWTGGRRWTGRVMRWFPHFHDYRASCLFFAGVNTAVWLLGAALFVSLWKRVAQRIGKAPTVV